MADVPGFGLVLVIATSAAIGVGRKVLERRRARRALRKQVPIDSTTEEGITVRATGIARVADETIVAPLSGRKCIVVRSRVFAGKGFTAMAAKPRETIAMVPFILDRGELGEIRVEGEHVLLDLKPLAMKRKDIDLDRQLAFMALHGVGAREHGNANFEETLVEPGDRITVAGLVMKDVVAEPIDESERGFRDALPTRVRLAGNVDHPLAIGRPLD